MGSEMVVVEDQEKREELNDVENTVFVAVGKNVKESKSLILWALQSFAGMKICLLHVHQSAQLVKLLDEKLSVSRMKQLAVKAFRELERQKMHKILNQYNPILDQAGVQTSKVWIETEDVEKGIVQAVIQHDIKWLVMGAAAEKLYLKDMLELKSNKAIYVCQRAPISCQIWFACKGCLVYTRERSANDADEEVNSFRSKTSTENVFTKSKSTPLLLDDARGNVTLPSPHESQDLIIRSFSDMFLEGPQGQSSSDFHDKLEYAIRDAEYSKQKAFEESIRRWKAEEDAKEALQKAEASENAYTKEISRRKEMEDTLVKQSEEIASMKSQRDRFIEELQIVKAQNPILLDQISKSRGSEKELEEKIIQAVNLLITFKEKRDKLQDERDNTRRKINKLTEFANEDTTGFSQAQFYKPSFLEIMEATKNFDQSLKIGEGRFGSVYKGILRNMRVAIKMLPSLGSQSDEGFEHEAEVLSRIRHPNLVTLIGICPESRSLIYEYLENGTLEDQIASQGKIPSLPWNTRIKIAFEMCSALIFLHGNKPSTIHSNLMLTNILLDSNYISKLSGLGINNLIFRKNQISSTSLYTNIDPEVSAYMDPEFHEHLEFTTYSDIYSFGVVLLRILTGRLASSVVKDTKCALENGNFSTILDFSAGDWPIDQAERLAYLGLRCCEKNRKNRPDLFNDIWATFESMKDMFSTTSRVESESHRRIPSYFVCPIFQEVMKDPYIAADGYTYEADAIKGWLNSGHETSPMTNLKLDHCDLLPNYALSYAIQEWHQHS